MKRLNGTAKSIWLFNPNDFNPQGKSLYSPLTVWLKEKYNFQIVPQVGSAINDGSGLAFKQGEFHVGEDTINVNCTIYNDGIVADTWSSTRDSDLFIEDALIAAAKDFGLTFDPQMIKSKLHVSELHVRLDLPLSNLNSRFGVFCEMLRSAFDKTSHKAGAEAPFELTGMTFSQDMSESVLKPVGFTIERDKTSSFSDMRFVSRSSFPTDDHLLILGEFEKILAE